MKPHSATTAELVELLGELEPWTLEKLRATGATIDEVASAMSALEEDDDEALPAPATPREAEVRAILLELVLEDFEEQESEREIART